MTDDAPKRTSKDDMRGDLAVVGRTVLINKPRAELFAYWRNFSNLPAFMDNLERVEALGEGKFNWVIKAPLDQKVSVITEIASEVEDQSIAWQSTAESEIKTNGKVEFADAPSGRGTIVTLEIAYQPPAGAVGRIIAKLFAREPNIQARQELKRFKMLMEAGEIARGPDQLKKEAA